METKIIKIDKKIYICSVCKKEYYDYTKEYDDGSLEKIDGKEEAETCEKQCRCNHKNTKYNYGKGRWNRDNRGFFQRCIDCNKIISEIENIKDEKTQNCMKEMYEIAKKYYNERKQKKTKEKCKHKNIKYSFDLSFYKIFFDKKCADCNKPLYTMDLGLRFDSDGCELNQGCMKEMYEAAKRHYGETIN